MKKKAVFLDLDGTLLNDRKEITPGNRSAIERALSAGHLIIITSGRPLVSTVPQADALGLDRPGCYVIACNGSVFYDNAKKEVISSVTLPLPVVQAVFAEAEKRRIHIQTYDETRVLVEPRCATENVEEYCRRIKMKWGIIDHIRDLKRAPEKMLMIDFQSRDPLDRFCEWISEQYGDILDTYYSNAHYVEIVKKGINKGEAILRMAELLGIAGEDTISAGDAQNDIFMIRSAHLGAAMANADPAVKAAADYVTQHDNNHDGIAEIIERFVLQT